MISLVLHTVIVTGAVVATLTAGPGDTSTKVDTQMVFLNQQEQKPGIEGRVMVQAIIDTTGRVEPNSVRVAESANPGFDQPAKVVVLKSLYRPGRVYGRAVRVLVAIPIDFKIQRNR